MNTSIRKTCEDVFHRIGTQPCESSMSGVETFIQSLEACAEHLDPLDRVALANLAAEYVSNWTKAEIFEAATRDQGYFTRAGRPNPTASRAASCRARMRPIMAAIQKLLHNAQREGEVEENAYGVETREARIAKTTNTTAQDSEFAPIAHREGEAPAEPPQPAMDDATPETPNEPITPPKNRAQRRAQARIERKQQRKAAKQLRNANRRSGTGV